MNRTYSRSVSPAADGSSGPQAISFISAQDGWALGPGACTRCARIWRTRDAGLHWSSLTSTIRLPGRDSAEVVEGLVDLDFVDAEDGYLFVSTRCAAQCVLVTSDAGRTWRSAPVPETSQVVNGTDGVYALSPADGQQPAELYRNTRGSRRWIRLRLPDVDDGPRDAVRFVVAADGDTVALLRLGTTEFAGLTGDASLLQRGVLWVSSTRGARWTQVTNPCSRGDGGAALISVALGHPNALLLDCYNGEQSSQEQRTQHHLYGTADAGKTWTRLADPATTGGPELLADNGHRHAFLVSAGGFGYELHGSLDGARQWHVVLSGGAGGYGMGDLRFIDPDVGFVLGPTHYSPEHIYRTLDAGRTWHPIPLPTG